MTLSRAVLVPMLLLLLIACAEEEAPKLPTARVAPALPLLEEAPPPHVVRGGILGGRGWFPEDPDELAAKVDALLDAAPEWMGPKPIALVAPHAGYSYAGGEQGKVYRTIRGGKYRRVFVLGVNHRHPLDGVSVPAFTHYETPLGKVPLDRKAMDRLLALGPPFKEVTAAHRQEHSIEIHLPFLQRTLGEFFLVPLLVSLGPDAVERAAELLKREIGPDDLVIVSSDNTHYGAIFEYRPFPNDDHVAENLEKLDMGAVERILALDLPGFATYRADTRITICGFHPISLLLALLPEDTLTTLTGYDTSGRTTGSYASSVSYVGIAFFAPLKEPEQELALRLARESMERFVRTGERLDPLAEGWDVPESLRHHAGAFVTLKIDGDLRGCIGDIFPSRALFRSILDRAISSCAEDRRFNLVTPAELPRIRIEISVLSPPRPVASPEDIVIGRHGILLSHDGRFRSVYLPQVAPEQGWDLETTLTNLSRKGGLAPDAWRSPGASFQVFTAQVFAEDE